MDIKRIGSGDESDHYSIHLMNIYLMSVLSIVVYTCAHEKRMGEVHGEDRGVPFPGIRNSQGIPSKFLIPAFIFLKIN